MVQRAGVAWKSYQEFQNVLPFPKVCPALTTEETRSAQKFEQQEAGTSNVEPPAAHALGMLAFESTEHALVLPSDS